MFTQFIFNEWAEICIIGGKLGIKGNNHQAPLNGSGLILHAGDHISTKQELGIIIEFKGILALPLHIHPFACYQFAEYRRIGNKFIPNIITNVRQLSEQFSGFEPVPKFFQVKGSNILIPQHIFDHMKEGGFAVALIANQNEGFAKFIAPVKTIPNHFFQQSPDFRIIASQPV